MRRRTLVEHRLLDAMGQSSADGVCIPHPDPAAPYRTPAGGKAKAAAIGSAAPLPDKPIDSLVAERTVFSPDRTHRFTLFRYWGDPDDYACGISMNPSVAAEDVGDPTVDGMVRRAKERWGVGAYYQLNVMSIRGSYSSDLARTPVVSLPDNDEWIRRIAARARLVVVSWGNPGHVSGRGPAVEAILREVCDAGKVVCFGKNKNGAPVHPLYQRQDAPLIPYFD